MSIHFCRPFHRAYKFVRKQLQKCYKTIKTSSGKIGIRICEAEGLIHETGTNVIGLLDGKNKDSSVADLAGPCDFPRGFDDVLDPTIVSNNFDHRFGQQVDVIFEAAINEGLSFLMAVPSDVENRQSRCHALDPLDQIVELFRADDALDQFHGWRCSTNRVPEER
jgi:hypothetical protein